MNLMAVIEAANEAVQKVRDNGKPYLLVCNTYRFRAHSMFDAELYRDKKEVEEWKKRDPIPEFQKFLMKQKMITEKEIKEIEKQVDTEIQKAVDFAGEGTWEPLDQLTKFVYSEKEMK
jgi:TPP-dependent pyruvate/acetoin dehydrogenase alpha subunit